MLRVSAVFESVDRTSLWTCLPEEYVSIITFIYSRISGRVKAYGKLSALFAVAECVLFFRFSSTLQSMFSRNGLRASWMVVSNAYQDRLTILEYADDILLLASNLQAVQLLLNRPMN